MHIFSRRHIEIFNEISYAVFRLTQSLSDLSLEAVLYYPFQTLQTSHSGKFTSEYSPNFCIETPENYFYRSPRVRFIPFNNDLIRCMK